MNLYKIVFTHYAPKGSREGFLYYLLANNDEELYEYLKPDLGYGVWEDEEDYEKEYYENNDPEEEGFKYYNEEGNRESFKEQIIRNQGDYETRDSDNLYYGFTNYGWELVKENVNLDELQYTIELGIIRKI